jgi:hypothetical protein
MKDTAALPISTPRLRGTRLDDYQARRPFDSTTSICQVTWTHGGPTIPSKTSVSLAVVFELYVTTLPTPTSYQHRAVQQRTQRAYPSIRRSDQLTHTSLATVVLCTRVRLNTRQAFAEERNPPGFYAIERGQLRQSQISKERDASSNQSLTISKVLRQRLDKRHRAFTRRRRPSSNSSHCR